MKQSSPEFDLVSGRSMTRCLLLAIFLPCCFAFLTKLVVSAFSPTVKQQMGLPLVVIFMIVQMATPFVACAWYPAQAYERRRSVRSLAMLLASFVVGFVVLWFNMALLLAAANWFEMPWLVS